MEYKKIEQYCHFGLNFLIILLKKYQLYYYINIYIIISLLMNHYDQQQPDACQHHKLLGDIQIHISKAYYNHTKTRQNAIDQLYLIQQQNDLLKIVKEQIQKKSILNDRFLTEQDIQQQSQYQTSKTMMLRKTKYWDKSLSLTPSNKSTVSLQSFRAKRNDIRSVSGIQQALDQINQKCSQQTYQSIKQIVKELKTSKQKIKYLKLLETNHQKLKKDYIVFKNRYEEQIILIKKLENKVKVLEDEKRKNAKLSTEKERHLIKKQTNLLVKEMLLNEDIKKLNHKIQNIKNKENVIQKDLQTVQNLWENILDKIEQGKSFEDSFKNNIYFRCKESLKNQRKVIVEQLQELDQQHAFIQKMLTHLKGT